MFPNDNRALQLQTRLGAPSIRSSRASLRSRESRNSRLRRMTASQEVNSNSIEIEAPSFRPSLLFRQIKFKSIFSVEHRNLVNPRSYASHGISVFFSVHWLFQSLPGPREDVQDRAGRGCSRGQIQLHHETVQRKICSQPQLNIRYMRNPFKMKAR